MENRSQLLKTKNRQTKKFKSKVEYKGSAPNSTSDFSWVIYSCDGNSTSIHTAPNKVVQKNSHNYEEAKLNSNKTNILASMIDMQQIARKNSPIEIKKMIVQQLWRFNHDFNESDFVQKRWT